MDTKELKLDLETVEQVADMLWLSSYIEKSKVVEEVKPTESKPREETPKVIAVTSINPFVLKYLSKIKEIATKVVKNIANTKLGAHISKYIP